MNNVEKILCLTVLKLLTLYVLFVHYVLPDYKGGLTLEGPIEEIAKAEAREAEMLLHELGIAVSIRYVVSILNETKISSTAGKNYSQAIKMLISRKFKKLFIVCKFAGRTIAFICLVIGLIV
jgi:hypothetical protein